MNNNKTHEATAFLIAFIIIGAIYLILNILLNLCELITS